MNKPHKWTPRFYIDDYGTNEPFPDQLEAYNKIYQFVQEFETDRDNQDYEVFKDFTGNYTMNAHPNYYYTPLGTISMSLACAEKLCEMLNNGEIEL